MTDLVRLIRRILGDPESILAIEPTETGKARVRIETSWVHITDTEAALLESIFYGPARKSDQDEAT